MGPLKTHICPKLDQCFTRLFTERVFPIECNLVFNSKAIILICINDAVPLPGRPPLPHAVLILGRFTGYTNSGPIYRLYRAAVNQLFAHLREFASFTDCVTTPITLQC